MLNILIVLLINCDGFLSKFNSYHLQKVYSKPTKYLFNIYKLGEFKVGDETVILSEKMDWPTYRDVVEVEICKDTLEKATRYCTSKIKEIFISNSRPRKQCQQHSSPFSRFQDK